MKRMEDGFRAMGFPADDDRDDVLDRACGAEVRDEGRDLAAVLLQFVGCALQRGLAARDQHEPVPVPDER